MELPEDFFKEHTKQEIVDSFNNQPLDTKIAYCNSWSVMKGDGTDGNGTYHHQDMGNDIFAKKYLNKSFCLKTGWIKDIFFWYKKDDEETKQENQINDLLNK